MALIMAGNFESEAQAQQAADTLVARGIRPEHVTRFFVNAPGQHALYPIGGDQDESPGAVDAQSGAAKGAAIGGAVGLGVGLAATPFLGPAAAVGGAGAGAYTGALVGALNDMGEHDSKPRNNERPAGVVVAVHAADRSEQDMIAKLLRDLGARQIEVADGVWRDGKWTDFDPASEPVPYLGSQQYAET